MRIAVTGIDGFVGRWLTRELSAAGHQVVGISSSRADVTDAVALGAWLGDAKPEAIVHLAAISFGPAAAGDPARAFEVTVGGTINLLEAARGLSPAPIVLVPSSGEVYGRPQLAALPLREDSAIRPVGAYALSKAAQEAVALAVGGRHGLPVIVARAFNHTGPGQRAEFVVPAIAARVAAVAKGRATVIPMGNVDVARDFLDVRDVVGAYRLLLEGWAAGSVPAGTVVNVCSGRSITIRRILEALCEAAGVAPSIEIDPSLVRKDEALEIRGDPSALMELVGWRPEIPIDRTLLDVLAEASAPSRA
jgi:GDP-4-dehydro-6-deoxy-D-mannose reductase